VNDDPAARDALRWAFDVAVQNGAVLVVVTAYSFPRAIVSIDGTAYFDIHDSETTARRVQTEVIAAELDVELPDARIHQLVAYGDPVTVLVAESSEADLLVVGRRASRVRRLLTGSVSKGCANRAACPVVIVHTRPRDGGTPRLPDKRCIVIPNELGRDAANVHGGDQRAHHVRRAPHIEAHRHRG